MTKDFKSSSLFFFLASSIELKWWTNSRPERKCTKDGLYTHLRVSQAHVEDDQCLCWGTSRKIYLLHLYIDFLNLLNVETWRKSGESYQWLKHIELLSSLFSSANPWPHWEGNISSSSSWPRHSPGSWVKLRQLELLPTDCQYLRASLQTVVDVLGVGSLAADESRPWISEGLVLVYFSSAGSWWRWWWRRRWWRWRRWRWIVVTKSSGPASLVLKAGISREEETALLLVPVDGDTPVCGLNNVMHAITSYPLSSYLAFLRTKLSGVGF